MSDRYKIEIEGKLIIIEDTYAGVTLYAIKRETGYWYLTPGGKVPSEIVAGIEEAKNGQE